MDISAATIGVLATGVKAFKTKQKKQVDSAVEPNPQEQLVNRNLTISVIALGFSVAGRVIYAPLTLVSVPLILYMCLYLLQEAYSTIFKERRLGVAVVDLVAIVGTLVAEYYVFCAITFLLYYLGEKILLKTQDHSRSNLINIFAQQPHFVRQQVDGVEVQTPLSALHAEDVIVINAGEPIPVDGCIITGVAAIDERMLTGEGQPVEKGPGEEVWAATMVLAGRICVSVEKAGAETMAAQIGQILNNTISIKSTLQTRAEELADQSALPTVGIGALMLMLSGPASAIAAFRCNFSDVMRLAAPLGALNFLKQASQNGILIKDGRALEQLNQVDAVVFDKTGTLTQEQPHVGRIHLYNGASEDALLTYAAAAEAHQSHPIAAAIREAALERQLELPPIDVAKYEVSYGIKAHIAGKTVRVGSARFMAAEEIALPDEVEHVQARTHRRGHSLVYVALDDQLSGLIELHPTLRPEARRVVQALKQSNLSIYMISGDHTQPTARLASELGIEHYFAEVLPHEKAELVTQLENSGKTVCFVGDGINDTIALKQADVSISLRGATRAATDTAQVILMDQNLMQLIEFFELAQRFDINVKRTVATTFVPGIICLAGVLFLDMGILGTILLYNAALIASVANAMLPAIKKPVNSNQ